jgi:pyrroline-5-carboxylate reductase
MTERAIGFIGGGRVCRILLAGLKRVGRLPSTIVVSDQDPAVLERLRKEFPTITALPNANGQAASQDLVFLGLHPPAMGAGMAEIGSKLKKGAVLISLAPKWPMAKMSQALGGFSRLARAIPNAPSLVNRGYNPICFSDALASSERQEIRDLFANWGEAPEVPEESLEAYAIIAAMGPTYLWYQLYQLAELGGSFGLTPQAASTAVQAMVKGALSTMTDAGLTPSEVMDLVPVKPLSGIETTVKDAYVSTLSGLHRKLKE